MEGQEERAMKNSSRLGKPESAKSVEGKSAKSVSLGHSSVQPPPHRLASE